MRVLLTTLNAKYIHTNLAIRLLYEQNHHREGLDWKELTIKRTPREIADACTGYDLVAFSCYIWNITQTLEAAKTIKEINPGTIILLGGPEVSYEYENVIALPQVDYIIAGEGEYAFTSFLDNFPQVENVPGLVFIRDGRLITNPPAPNFDLSQLSHSMPYQFDDPETLRSKVLYIETSRGCPYKCGFCLASLDNKVRFLPDKTIHATLLFLMKHGRVIKFLDRTFNIKRDFTLRIFEFILQNHQPGNVFQFEITADILHPDIIRFIQEKVPPGLFRFEIGIQTVNQSANLAVGRKQNYRKTRDMILQLQDYVEMHLDLIVGLPLDTWQDIRHSITEVFNLFPGELQLGFLKMLKGTPVRDEHRIHEYTFDPLPPYQLKSSKYLSAGELEGLSKTEAMLEIFWNSGKARNTLRYAALQYNIFDFLSQLGERFASNTHLHEHTMEEVYVQLHDFVCDQFPEDQQFAELAGIDYYLHFKVRPKPMFLQEVPTEQYITETLRTAPSSRYIGLKLSFDFGSWRENKIPNSEPAILMLHYNATDKANVVASIKSKDRNFVIL